MILYRDIIYMENWKELTDNEIKMGFIASCIENAAAITGNTYKEMFDRMEAVDLIDKYIYPCYDALHTESRQNLVTDILDTLISWEQKKSIS